MNKIVIYISWKLFSNLGPLFFFVFFNDLQYDLGSDLDCYEDDTTITETVSKTGIKLTSDCARLDNLMKSNKLKLYPDNPHITRNCWKTQNLTETVGMTVDHCLFEEDPQIFKLLLVCPVHTNMKLHIKNLLGRLENRVSGLMKIRFILPFNIRQAGAELCQAQES